MAMGPGIVAVDIDNIGWEGLAKAVLAVAAIGYAVLWVLTILRIRVGPSTTGGARPPDAPGVGAGFLTHGGGHQRVGSPRPR